MEIIIIWNAYKKNLNNQYSWLLILQKLMLSKMIGKQNEKDLY